MTSLTNIMGHTTQENCTLAEKEALLGLANVSQHSAETEMLSVQLLQLQRSPMLNGAKLNNFSSPPQSNSSPPTPYSTPEGFSDLTEKAIEKQLDESERSERPIEKGKIKYDILEGGVAYPRHCGDCDAQHTSGHWCLDTTVHNGHICQKCYRRRRRAIDSGKQYRFPERKCNDCHGQTKTKWYRHGSIVGIYLCGGCHNKGNKPMACNTCGGHEKLQKRANGVHICKWCSTGTKKPSSPVSNNGQLSPVLTVGNKSKILPPLHLLSSKYCQPKKEIRGNPYLPPLHLYIGKKAVL